MALDDLLISTGVDQLIRLVKESGRIEIGEAAKQMKQPVRTIEDWAHVLEEEGLVLIEYKLTKIYLVWHSPTEQYVAQKAERLEAKKNEAKGDIERLLSKVEKGGAELAGMQTELFKMDAASLMTPAEIQKLKSELAELDRNYSASVKSAAEKLERLRKKMLLLGPKVNEKAAAPKAPADEMEKELAVLLNFEKTIQSQIDDNETFFGAFETRLEDFRKRIEEDKGDEKLDELKGELAEVKSLKSELSGAMEAMADEQKTLDERIAEIAQKISELSDSGDSLAGAKKKLAELRRMGEDARKQKEAVADQLSDALSLVRKQTAKVQQIVNRQESARQAMQALKEEYVDIAEEISRANGELADKQKEVSAKIASQQAALDAGRMGAGSRISKDELQKVSFLLREMKREQALLEEKVRLLLKEAEILRLESEPAGGRAKSAQGREEKEQAVAFVEKVKLSQGEEDEFERKRDELRSLIRKMWEESKGTPPS